MVEGVHYNKCGARRLACVGRKSCLYITQLPVYTKLKNSIFRRGVSGRCDGLTLWVMCSRASSTGATSWVHVGEYAKKVRLQVQQPPAVSRRPLLCDQTPQYLLVLTSSSSCASNTTMLIRKPMQAIQILVLASQTRTTRARCRSGRRWQQVYGIDISSATRAISLGLAAIRVM